MQANDLNNLFDSLKNSGQPNEAQVRSAVRGLNAAQRSQLDEILSSPEKMKALLGSDAAKDLLKKLGKNGG